MALLGFGLWGTVPYGDHPIRYQCPLLHLAVWLMRRNWVIFLLEADADPLKKDRGVCSFPFLQFLKIEPQTREFRA